MILKVKNEKGKAGNGKKMFSFRGMIHLNNLSAESKQTVKLNFFK